MIWNGSLKNRRSSSCHWMVNGAGHEDQAAVDGLPELELLDKQAGHDRLARARIVGEQEAQPRLWQHLPIDRLYLVRQGADARQADRELAVVGVGETDARGLHQQAELLGVRRELAGCVCGSISSRGTRSSPDSTASSSSPVVSLTRNSAPDPSGRASSIVTGSAKWPGNVTRRPTRLRREATTEDSMQRNDTSGGRRSAFGEAEASASAPRQPAQIRLTASRAAVVRCRDWARAFRWRAVTHCPVADTRGG